MVHVSNMQAYVASVWSSLFRVKKYYRLSSLQGDEPQPGTTALSLANHGLYPCVAFAVFVMVGQTCKDISGPAIVISVVIAAVSSILSGTCYAELRCRVPRLAGTAYDYIYYTVGEVVAVFACWCGLLSYSSAAAASARAISQNFDYLIGSPIWNMTATNIGMIPHLNSYPDFLSVLVVISAVITVALKNCHPTWLTIMVNAAILLFVIFFTVVGVFHIRFSNWTEGDGYFKYGINGVLAGAASCIYAFSGVDTIISAVDVTVVSRKTILIACSFLYGVGLVMLLGFSSTISLLAPNSDLVSDAVVAEAYILAGVTWGKYFLCLGAIIILWCVLHKYLCFLPKILNSLALDGLLCPKLMDINDRTETPLLGTLICGGVVTLFAMLISLTDLVQLLALSILPVYTSISVSTLVMHYKPPEMYPIRQPQRSNKGRKRRSKKRRDLHSILKRDFRAINCGSSRSYGSTSVNNNGDGETSEFFSHSKIQKGVSFDDSYMEISHTSGNTVPDAHHQEDNDESSSDTDIDAIVDEYRERIDVATWSESRAIRDDIPNHFTAKRASWAVTLFTLWMICLCAILAHGTDLLKQKNPTVIILLCLFVAFSLLSVAILLRQPQDYACQTRLIFTAPYVPWVPLITIIINVYLALQLPPVTWVCFSIWIVTGAVVYMFYGRLNSYEARGLDSLAEEERVLLQPIPRHEMTSQIVRHHRKSDRAPQRLQQVDTVLIGT